MSSAAVQPSSATITNHQYQHSSHTRDPYYAQQASNGQSPSQPSRRTSKRPQGGNGASPNAQPSTPQQPQYYSPAGSNSSNMTTPRAQPLPHSTAASPLATTTPSVSPSVTTAGGPPFAPPPRSSSNHRSHNTSSSPSDNESVTKSPDARQLQQVTGGYSSEKRDDSKRRQQTSQKDSPRHATSNRTKSSPSRSRSDTAVGQTPVGAGLVHEESTVINRVGISDPQEDLAREQARIAESRPMPPGTLVTPVSGLELVSSSGGVDDGGRVVSSRSRQEKSDRPRKETKFGDYYLGQTLGEGEFGKVKMGWKRDSGVQVAIKLIRRETLGSNPGRLPKIYREIAILRELQHPNIVRLHEMVETERHIGIILEYASGGELFDYILNHRYLKDNAARRLFAQLVSGVGYLHKKGIVHRDLKLENLLLDRNRNIIITDFGFANTFNPKDELSEEIEYGLTNKEFVKKFNLDAVGEDGHRRGDLMQTSCGSPCYAAPELVVTDSLYTGRKVDVWSCGVILYAMLAGYLPFDDDPANPEGDNISLLYKYIVSTPLTFPEYVTPHARDLLKRILVPDPRKRADLFEVARHSWLSEYAHVVGFITSSTTTEKDIANTTVTSETYEAPSLARSASVREPTKSAHVPVSPIGGLSSKTAQIDQQQNIDKAKGQRDAKRRTVQVEYVAPQSSTAREAPQSSTEREAPQTVSQPRTRVRGENQGPIEVRPPTTSTSSMPPPARPSRDVQRAASESTALQTATGTRPSTGGSMSGSRLPSRGNSYGQPAVATVAATNAQGHFSQPRGKQYIISTPMTYQTNEEESIGRLSTQRMPSNLQEESRQQRSHKRSNTVGGITEKIFGKTSSMFGGRTSMSQEQRPEKPHKSYPPTTMNVPVSKEDVPRKSTESRRTSFSFNRKNNDRQDPSGGQRTSRRFSLIPSSLSKTFMGNQKDNYPPRTSHSSDHRRGSMQQPTRTRAPSKPKMAFGRRESRSPSQSTTNSTIPVVYDNGYDRRERRDSPASQLHNSSAPQPHSASAVQTHFSTQGYPSQYPGQTNPEEVYYRDTTNSSTQLQQYHRQAQQPPSRPQYPEGFKLFDENTNPHQGKGDKPAVLQKNRKFTDAYEQGAGHYAGSSGAARRVMDFFRKRGKARTGE